MPDLAKPILMGAMLGVCNPDELLQPGGSRAGDALLLTKGLAIEGTALLAKERAEVLREQLGDETVAAATRLLKHPGISIVDDAHIALSAGGVTALHDPTEGGLATAIREIAAVSGLGARVAMEKVPVLPETTAVASTLGLNPLGMLASGSLLLAVEPKSAPETINALATSGIPATRIGTLIEDPEEFILELDGAAVPMPEFAVDEVARLFAEEQAQANNQEIA
jgi:hydrogenase maturation factor